METDAVEPAARRHGGAARRPLRPHHGRLRVPGGPPPAALRQLGAARVLPGRRCARTTTACRGPVGAAGAAEGTPGGGDAELGRAFLRLARRKCSCPPTRTARSPHPSTRLRKEALRGLSRSILTTTDIKTGLGGLRDIEFLAQGLQLVHAHEDARAPAGRNASRACVRWATAGILSRGDRGAASPGTTSSCGAWSISSRSTRTARRTAFPAIPVSCGPWRG